MTAKELENAIIAARMNDSIRHSTGSEYRFLKSITASCKHLPHSNEACDEARQIYFSFLVRFGLPSILLTITPDDLRSFRIIVYSCNRVEKLNGDYSPSDFSEEDVLDDFKFRHETRSQYPGLCAEDYRRIVGLVIKHIFKWNCDEQEASEVGLLGRVLAWCLATEEQARKTLHGHFLLFIKGWRDS